MTVTDITVEHMRPALLTLDTVREALAATEPLSAHEFSVGPNVWFTVQPGWQHGIDAKNGNDLVDAVIQTEVGTEYQLTKDALLEATSVVGLPRVYVCRSPSELVESPLNYWYRGGLSDRPGGSRSFQLLVAGGDGVAITRASVNPFSNLRLLQETIAGVEAKYGQGEVLADYKFTHSLRRTHLRLVVPEYQRNIDNTGVDNDNWSVGIQIKNSLIGEGPTSIEGYLFRWWCTNGAVDTRNSSGVWSRRGSGRDDDVYEWARATVDEVLGGLEGTLDDVQSLTDIPVHGEANDVLRDVFAHYRVPVAERTRIIENMVDSEGPLTMYSVMAAITEVANTTALDPSHVENLLRMGGDLPHAAHSRCGSCRRIMPH